METAKKLRILLVDDDHEQLRVLTRWLADHEVVATDHATRALALLEGERFDVVISDNSMPDITGVELLTEISGRYPEVLRIMHSGAEPRDLEHLAADGIINRFIAKPGHHQLVTLCERTARNSKLTRA